MMTRSHTTINENGSFSISCKEIYKKNIKKKKCDGYFEKILKLNLYTY